MSIDYNEKDRARGRKYAKQHHKSASFSGTMTRRGYPVDTRNNNKYTGFTVSTARGGVSQKTASGTDGLHLNQDSVRVDTAHNKNKVEWSGGGNTSTKNVHGDPCVGPE